MGWENVVFNLEVLVKLQKTITKIKYQYFTLQPYAAVLSLFNWMYCLKGSRAKVRENGVCCGVYCGELDSIKQKRG